MAAFVASPGMTKVGGGSLLGMLAGGGRRWEAGWCGVVGLGLFFWGGGLFGGVYSKPF